MNVSSNATQGLIDLFKRYPSLRVNARPDTLSEAARLLPADQAKEVLRVVGATDKSEFLQARSAALATLAPPQPKPGQQKWVVSGLSAGGLALAAMLAKTGRKVEAFEQRTGYVREMQFSNRQAAVDFLSSIDPKLPDRFFDTCAELEASRRSINGEVTHTPASARPKYQPGDPTRVATNAEDMLKPMPSGIVQCNALEKMLMEYLREQPNVTIHQGKVIELGEKDADGYFSKPFGKNAKGEPGEKIDLGVRPMIFAWEGIGSATRKAAGVENVPISPALPFIAGQVEMGADAAARSRMNKRDEVKRDGTAERVITQLLETQPHRSTRAWVLTGVPDAAMTEFDVGAHLSRLPDYLADRTAFAPNEAARFEKTIEFLAGLGKLDPKKALKESDLAPAIKLAAEPRSEAHQQLRQLLVERRFAEGAALVLDESPEKVLSRQLHGAMVGTRPTLFDLQLRISKSATAGQNVVLGGDSVANGSFTQGAGNMTALALHPELVKQLLFDLERGVDQATAMKTYGEAAQAASIYWGAQSIGDMYPWVDRSEAAKVFTDVAQKYVRGEVKDPLKTLDALIAKLPIATNPVVGAVSSSPPAAKAG